MYDRLHRRVYQNFQRRLFFVVNLHPRKTKISYFPLRMHSDKNFVMYSCGQRNKLYILAKTICAVLGNTRFLFLPFYRFLEVPKNATGHVCRAIHLRVIGRWTKRSSHHEIALNFNVFRSRSEEIYRGRHFTFFSLFLYIRAITRASVSSSVGSRSANKLFPSGVPA